MCGRSTCSLGNTSRSCIHRTRARSLREHNNCTGGSIRSWSDGGGSDDATEARGKGMRMSDVPVTIVRLGFRSNAKRGIIPKDPEPREIQRQDPPNHCSGGTARL